MKKITNNFEKIFLIFLYLQPFLDITSGILLHFGYNITISSVIRLIFMFLCIIYLLFYVKEKKINIFLIILLLYFGIFTMTIFIVKDIHVLVYEIKNMLSTYYFVVMLLTLLKLYKNKTFNIKNLLMLYITYLLFVFIPNILNIGFNSYWHSKEGSVGWFVSANVVGSIISIILPLLLINIRKLNISLIILALINIYVIFSIGTKVPVLSFIIIFTINLIYYIVTIITKKQYKKLIIIIIPFIIILLASTLIFPKTSFYKNIVIHITFLEKKGNGKIDNKTFVDHFIFSQRLTFEENTRKSYVNSSILEKIVGIGYIENYSTDSVNLKNIEIDYFDIFYRHGILGFIIFFIPVIYSLKNIIKNFKRINFETLNIILSIILIFILALFQGHIFVTPANSIYVALLLSIIHNNSLTYEKQA